MLKKLLAGMGKGMLDAALKLLAFAENVREAENLGLSEDYIAPIRKKRDDAKCKFLAFQIREALNDYQDAQEYGSNDDIDRISSQFIKNLAHDSVYGEKAELREVLRRHPAWNEILDGVMVKSAPLGYCPNLQAVHAMLYRLVRPAIKAATDDDNYGYATDIDVACKWFSMTEETAENEKERALEALNRVAPHAYHAGRKMSKITRQFLNAIGVVDDHDREFNQIFAKICDEYADKPAFDMLFSVNPATFMTMSNPQGASKENRFMTSCHSIDGGCSYRAGTSGYARDEVTIIAYNCGDFSDHFKRNTRKTKRQLFMYEVDNGLLLQSRLYKCNALDDDDYGGTVGEQPENKPIRAMAESIIAEIEGQPNLWRSFKYYNNSENVYLETGCGFTGYPDWPYQKFHAVVAIRKDKADDWHNFRIGTHALCWACGDENHDNDEPFCDDCNHEGMIQCAECGEWIDEDDAYRVYDSYGDEVDVCYECRRDYYRECAECGEYYHRDNTQWVESIDDYVCDDCYNEEYAECAECGEVYRRDDMMEVTDSYGHTVHVCNDCLNESGNYVECDKCGEWVHIENTKEAIRDGYEVTICDDCAYNYFEECDDCGRLVDKESLHDATDADGNPMKICDDCTVNYTQCDDCGTFVPENCAYIAYTNSETGEVTRVCGKCLDLGYLECVECGEYFSRKEMREGGYCKACFENTGLFANSEKAC